VSVRKSIVFALIAAIALGFVVLGLSALHLINGDEGETATLEIASLPADRYSSRGILPLEIDAELGAIEVYLVEPDGSLLPPPQGARQEIWELAVRIMTLDDATSLIERYKVANSAASTRTAWVVERPQGEDDWSLGVNLATTTDPVQLAATLVHEYAHLVSLRGSQVVASGAHCTTVELPEGCALPGSYLDAFAHAFWADYGDEAPSAANSDAGVARAFFASRPGDFVSEYAAMNVTEDFAESFAAYVHTDVVPHGPGFAAKIAFFDRFEEMAGMRDRIRAELGDALGRYRLG